MKRRRIMREFAITEISAVDHPAQKGALAAIIKSDAYAKLKAAAKSRADWREANPEKEFAEMPRELVKLGVGELIAKMYLDPSQGATSFDDVVQQCMDQQRYYEVMDTVGSSISALDASLRSIVADQAVDSAQKQNMIRDSVESFMAAIRTRWPDVEEALASAPETMSGPMMGQVSPAYKGDSDMDAKELETQVASLTKQLDTATKASKDGKIAVDLQKSLDELNVKLAETTTKLGEETAKAGMSDAEKAHMATLSGKDKFAFMTAAPDERKKMMAKSAEGDEVVTIEGQQVSKRAVGDAQFEIIKRQAVKIAANEAEIAKERTAREDAEFSKRAETELSHLPGETVVKVKVLRHLEKADADVKDAVSKMLEAGDKAITAAYAKLGVKGGDVTKSSNGDPKAFEKRIVEVQTANKALSRTEAMAQARKQYPEEFKVYQDQQ